MDVLRFQLGLMQFAEMVPDNFVCDSGAPVDNAADLSAADREGLIQPPGLASAKELLRIATAAQRHAAPLLGEGVMGSGPSDAVGAPRPEGQAAPSWGSKSFLLVWADTAEPVRLTPSVLLAHLILCSRRVSAMVQIQGVRVGLNQLRCTVCYSPPLITASPSSTCRDDVELAACLGSSCNSQCPLFALCSARLL